MLSFIQVTNQYRSLDIMCFLLLYILFGLRVLSSIAKPIRCNKKANK